MLVASTTLPLVIPSLFLSNGTGPGVITSCQGLYINTGGVTRVSVLSGGDVGIGTTNPQNLLDVSFNGAPVLEVFSTTGQSGIGINNYLNFGVTNYSQSLGSNGFGLSESGGVIYFNDQNGPNQPLDGYYQEYITGPTILAPYGVSLVNSFTGSYSVTLMSSNTGAVKIISLYEDNGSQVTVNTPQGSVYVKPGLFNQILVSNSQGLWYSLSQNNISFFTTKQQALIVAPDDVGGAPEEGYSVNLSADGNTLAFGGPSDNSGTGATWIYTRSGTSWSEQAKLIGSNATGKANQGVSVALSADGNTLAFGGDNDNSSVGATWIFTRSGTTWAQQGLKLVGTGGTTGEQGYSVALSANGNILAVGGIDDSGSIGATWIFTRSGTTWTQQGSKLVGTGHTGNSNQGYSVSLSADGNTLAIGGAEDSSGVGATWIFTNSSGTWTQLGGKIVGTGYVGSANQGSSVSLSADGNTLAIGGPNDNGGVGATWIFTNVNQVWTQLGNKLVGTGAIGTASQGISVSLSADGNTLAVGGNNDNNGIGATWIFTRISNTWSQQVKLVGTGGSGTQTQGNSVSLSSNASTLAVGGPFNNNSLGGTWIFT
jgi:hypothetical protein